MANEAHGPEWESLDLDSFSVLSGVLSGRVTSGILSSRFPASPHASVSILAGVFRVVFLTAAMAPRGQFSPGVDSCSCTCALTSYFSAIGFCDVWSQCGRTGC